MDEQMIQTIEKALKCGDRVELIPTKDYVKIVRVRREEIGKKAIAEEISP